MRQPITLLLPLFTTFFIFCSLHGAVSDPQTYLLSLDCYQYDRDEYDANKSFNDSVSAALRDLRYQVANQRMSFATSEQWWGTDISLTFYAVFLCRNYLSVADCVACFTDAAAEILNCSAGTSFARVIYDGCFLRWSIQQGIGRAESCWRRSGPISCQRYEDTNFRDEPKSIANPALCGKQTPEAAAGFTSAAQQLLMNVQTTTPNVTGFQAAVKTQVSNNGPTIYAYAQCIQSLSQSECEICLMQGYNTLQTCLPGSDGRAYVDGCFMRYSTTFFFPDDQTIIITPLAIRGSSKKGAIIGAIVGGVAFVLILLALLAYIRRSKRRERVSNANGDIIGESSNLIGSPVNYSYGDLRFATKNFSVENKLGEGGFGVVYKGTLKNGKVVAVKKLTLCYSKRVEEEFQSEVKLISNVHHRNLVQLLGCCSKGSERILVYEYMKNTSLDRFLFGLETI
ncbi:cysteine-rich receptor-like protein kinase 2 isoform X2 [Prosopis cineraria]|uniref:cysteine-rich receptor-like protein kinase 2 isoform X2 n=1 Tax=Prosopis cineraria TaxID=364024 RepID=UPI0024109F37|nr:cysteine-rich receptor-like protein kinase 2 isoform X2 [Prosopis cineraria]